MPEIITRFAPSPTGSLHIGSARTALFNWLYAKHYNGKFLLRIEDTDQQRSTSQAVDEIFHTLKWLGLPWDEEPVFQSQCKERHQEVVQQLLAEEKAYYCYCTPEELESMRDQALKEGRPPLYDSKWRETYLENPPSGIQPTVRLKSPKEGETCIKDNIQGTVIIKNSQLDDMVLLRSDGTPTYMLAVVVDDHDMNVTHIIRGDDHFTNTFRQAQIYYALGWTIPITAHIPLIHGTDGAKLSKRHGATSVDDYREMGILSEAMFNYLLRLGWGHGDEEIISVNQAIKWFDFKGLGKSPSRFDINKLLSLNAHYLRKKSSKDILKCLKPILEETLSQPFSQEAQEKILLLLPALQQRSKTLMELKDQVLNYCLPEIWKWKKDVKEKISSEDYQEILTLFSALKGLSPWDRETLETFFRTWTEQKGIKLGQIAKPLRILLTGDTISPGIFEVLEALGPVWTQKRIEAFTKS